MADVKRSLRLGLVPLTPTAVPPAVLDGRTVARVEVLDQRLRAAAAAKSSRTRRHTLIVAPRGGGKTHVLTVFAHRVRSDPGLADGLRLALLSEDAAEVATHADLLTSVIEALSGDGAHDAARALRLRGETAELEGLLLAALDDRPLILVIENLDRLFSDMGVGGPASAPGVRRDESRHRAHRVRSRALRCGEPAVRAVVRVVHDRAARPVDGRRGRRVPPAHRHRGRRRRTRRADRLGCRTGQADRRRPPRWRAATPLDDPGQLSHRAEARRARTAGLAHARGAGAVLPSAAGRTAAVRAHARRRALPRRDRARECPRWCKASPTRTSTARSSPVGLSPRRGRVDRLARLAGMVLASAEARIWERASLERWMEHWRTAVEDVRGAEVLAVALEVMRREADGDATARPALPPELRDIVPRLRVAETQTRVD